MYAHAFSVLHAATTGKIRSSKLHAANAAADGGAGCFRRASSSKLKRTADSEQMETKNIENWKIGNLKLGTPSTSYYRLALFFEVDNLFWFCCLFLGAYYLAQQVGRYVPPLAVLGDDGNGFLVILDKGAELLATAGGLEGYLIAGGELHHFPVGVHRIQELQSLDNLVVQGDQLVVGQRFEIDFHLGYCLRSVRIFIHAAEGRRMRSTGPLRRSSRLLNLIDREDLFSMPNGEN